VRWVWAKEATWHYSFMEVVGSQTGEFSDPPDTPHKVKTLGARLGAVRNSEACISKGATVQTLPWCSKPRQQPFTTSPKGRALEAPHVLKPKASSGLLQVSPPHPRGGLRRRHELVMPLPICNYVHRIVLPFYVSFCLFIPHVVNYFSVSHLWFELCNPVVGGSA
jgi:hypothetical protein